MSELVIRPMTEGDIAALCIADGGETPENRECFERYLTWQDQAKDCVFLLAFLDGQLAGHLFVFYHDDPSLGQGMDLPRLADLRVFEPYRRQGVGRALLDAGEAVAKTVSDRVFLTVDEEENKGFLGRFYASAGFVEVKELRWEQTLVMIKTLN